MNKCTNSNFTLCLFLHSFAGKVATEVSPDIGAWGRTDYLADFDAGSDVDRSDLGEFAAAYGFTSADNNYNALCDFGSDGDVDGPDLKYFG